MLSVIIFLLTVFFSGSHQQCFSKNDTTKTHIGESYYNWIDSRNDFSVSMFKLLSKDENRRNLIFSPSSLHDILLVAYFGAAGYSEASLAKTLRKPRNIAKSHAWRFYQTERAIYSGKEKESYPLKTANKIFFSNKLQLRPCIRKNLRTETELIDFKTNAEWATTYITRWMANITGMMYGLGDLDSETIAIMVNAVALRAKWAKKFNRNDTERLPFRVNATMSSTSEMMQIQDYFSFDYLDTIKARVLKLPYEGEKQAMIILLPDGDLDTMIDSLSSKVIKLITSTDMLKVTREIKVALPKYMESRDIKLNWALRKLGIGNTLTRYADFSRFTGRKEIFFFDVNQNAGISVFEEEIEVKGSSPIDGTFRSGLINPMESFICDRPFAYFIYDYVTNKILFMGNLRYPINIIPA